MTSTTVHGTAASSRGRTVLLLSAASAVAIGVNAAIAAVAGAAGAPAGFGPLTLPAYGLFTILGVAVGWFGWTLVRARAMDPRRVLLMLVPAVVLVSFVPDVLLLVLRFIPGTTTAAVVALMLMHVVVVAAAVPAYVLASRGRGARRISVS